MRPTPAALLAKLSSQLLWPGALESPELLHLPELALNTLKKSTLMLGVSLEEVVPC